MSDNKYSGVDHSITMGLLREGLSRFQPSDHVWINPEGNLSIFRGGLEPEHFIAEIKVEEKVVSWEYNEPIEKIINLNPSTVTASYALRNHPDKIEYGGSYPKTTRDG